MHPTNIGRYVVKSEIARGGMAAVYLAYDPYVKREVAIKLLPAILTHDPTFRARFEREAQTVAALEYQAIVPVYDYGEEHGQPYLVMRYMAGGPLSVKIKNGPLPPIEVSRIFNRLGAALDYVHAKGIIHRDLKPGNILFDVFNNAYLSDFGIAHITEANAALTGEGMIGTPAYMSPEQARGDSCVDRLSDIYGMGAILFEMLTGRQPYEATTPMGVAVKHITEPIPNLLDLNTDIPAEFQTVIEKAMAKDPDQRYQTAARMAQALSLIANKTLKNPPLTGAETTARIILPSPVRVHMPQKGPAQPDQSQAGMLRPPVYNPPASVSPHPQPSIPGASAQPRPTPSPSPPPSTPPQPSAHPPSEPRQKSGGNPPVWLWTLLGLAGLGAVCGLILMLLWLVYG
jgi:serine/threonine protein kinase